MTDTAEYVRFRLAAAGSDRALFPDDALATLHEHSQAPLGEIRRVNALVVELIEQATDALVVAEIEEFCMALAAH